MDRRPDPVRTSFIHLLLVISALIGGTSFGYWAGSERSRAEIVFELAPCGD